MTSMTARRTPAAVGATGASPRVGVIVSGGALADELARASGIEWHIIDPSGAPVAAALDTIVYVPVPARPPDTIPDLPHARAAWESSRRAGTSRAIVVSSTAAYGATPHHAGLATEARTPPPTGQPIAGAWLAYEAAALEVFGAANVTILRAAPWLAAGAHDFFNRLFTARVTLTLPGHDPTLQFLSVADLARAIVCAVHYGGAGFFNIVPRAPIALRAALRRAGRRQMPVPWSVQRLSRAWLGRPSNAASHAQLQFVRYHLTASPEKSADELRFAATDSSADAIVAAGYGLRGGLRGAADEGASFDPFGLDRAYIDRCGRGLMGFLHRRYWRVETRGLERIPAIGPAVLVGMHRGFMPFDGVMTLLSVVQRTGRVPRFLIHPGVGLRFPFLFDLMSKLGGVIAGHENAGRILRSGELLGVYPEGIRGAFTMYRDAHRIGPSWRNDCVKFALRHRAPLIPFVTAGSAEIFPILARVHVGWWKKYTEWPFIPITPTFPLLPVPLPSKWHTLFLEPWHVEREYPAEAASDRAIVGAISVELKRRMEAAVADLAARRRSIFFGSIFEREREREALPSSPRRGHPGGAA